MSDKVIKAAITRAMKGNTWKKLANLTVAHGKTAFPQKSADQEKFGIRFDYDTVVTQC